MKLVVIAVGRVRGPLAPVVAEYEARAGRYWKLEVVEVAAGGAASREQDVRDAEGRRLLARLPAGLEVVALTRSGRGMHSRELAGYLNDHGLRSSTGVAFLIGGAFGLAADVLTRADRELSLSELTLPHEMARLLLAEQLYRAGTIIRGEPYHKG